MHLRRSRSYHIRPPIAEAVRLQTNGKTERFICTLLTEWAYVRAYRSSASRAEGLPHNLHFYSTERPRIALGDTTSATHRVSVNNLFVINT
jgi:transposase InsO family protein